MIPLLLALGCTPPHTARVDALAPPHPVEVEAAERLADAPCGAGWSLLWPGLGQLCSRQPDEGAVMAGLAAAELGATAALWSSQPPEELFTDGGAMVPLVALQDLYVASWGLAALDRRRARGLRYTPLDSTADLLLAPFNPQVLRDPWVWGSLAGALGFAVGFTVILDGPLERPPGGPVDLFGAQLPAGLGYPAAAAAGTALFSHVAIAEEVAFRGLLQSNLTRRLDSEWGGWALASLVFGGIHAANVLALPPEDRRGYLVYSVPAITVVGSVLGLVYMEGGYTLTKPVAVHFWYDLALVGLDVVQDPDEHMFSMQISGGF